MISNLKNQQLFNWLFVIISLSSISSLISRHFLFLENFLFIPLNVLLIVFLTSIIHSRIFSQDFKQSFVLFSNRAIIAGLIGGIFNIFYLWKPVLSYNSFNITYFTKFLFSGGILSFYNYPGSFLRGFFLAFFVISILIILKENHDFRKIKFIFLTYLSGISIFFIPSLIVYLSSYYSVNNSTNSFIDMFSNIAIRSYWNNSQALRWITNSANQLDVSFLLFSSSIILLILFIVWFFYFFQDIKKIFQRTIIADWLFVILSVFTALTFAYQSQSFIKSPNYIVWFVFLILVLLMRFIVEAKDSDLKFWIMLFIVFSGLILGWSVFFIIISFLSLIYLLPLQINFSSKKNNIFYNFIFFISISFLSAFFIINRNIFSTKLEITILISQFIFLFYSYLPYFKNIYFVIVSGLIISIIFSIMFLNLIPLAISILLIVFAWLSVKIKPQTQRFIPEFIAFSWFVIIFINNWLLKFIHK